MKIFVDANVIIDYLVDRMPFADDAEAVIDACVQDGNEGAFTGHPDFEDTLQIAAAMAWGADVIVTRDKDGFADSPVKVLAPAEFLNVFGEERQ